MLSNIELCLEILSWIERWTHSWFQRVDTTVKDKVDLALLFRFLCLDRYLIINEALITLVFTELSRTGMRTSSHCVLPASHRAVNEQ